VSSAIAIRCRGLTKRYPGGVVAVDGLDLDVTKGQCFGLLGPNGAGKTTTVEILEGLLEPSGGDVVLLGMRWKTDEARLRPRVGVSLQETHLPERLTVAETLALFRSFYPRGKDVGELLRVVALEDKKGTWTSRLSGGQRQRLALACALLGDPEILFLDEPTSGLDPQARGQLWNVVQTFTDAGGTVLLTTHSMEEAERMCDALAIVDAGRVIAAGRPAELIASVGGHGVVEFACTGAAPDEAVLARITGVLSVRRTRDGIALAVDHVHGVLPALLAELARAGASLARVATRSSTLEDVFVTLTGRHLRD
jgi:ABC-2 type transport system ATP-binding protein